MPTNRGRAVHARACLTLIGGVRDIGGFVLLTVVVGVGYSSRVCMADDGWRRMGATKGFAYPMVASWVCGSGSNCIALAGPPVGGI